MDRLTGCRSALWRILRAGREGGRAVALSVHALSLLALDHFVTGEWQAAQALADEHPSLCRTHSDRHLGSARGVAKRATPAAGAGARHGPRGQHRR